MTITPGQHQQTIQAAGGGGPAMARGGRTDATGARNPPHAGPDGADGAPTTGRDCQPGGHAAARESRVVRRRRGLEGLEHRLSMLCVCLLCAVELDLGTGGEIGQPGAQRNPHARGGIVLHAGLQHAGDAVQGDGPHASGERWRAGGLGELWSCTTNRPR